MFDTGENLPQRTRARNGAVALLAGLQLPAGYLAAVIPWGGLVRGFTDTDGIDLLWTALNGRAPAIAIALGARTKRAGSVDGFASKHSLGLDAYFFSNHRRDETDGRLAPDVVALADVHADPGLDTMMEHAEELLIGQYPGSVPSIKQIEFVDEDELRTEGDFTLWVQRYSVVVDRIIKPNRTVIQLLVDMRTKVRASNASVANLTAEALSVTTSAVWTLTKTAADGWGNAGGSSKRKLAGDGYVTFTIAALQVGNGVAIGLSPTDPNQDISSIRYGFQLAGAGVLNIYESGVLIGAFGTYAIGDVLRVQRTGTVITYRRNGEVLYTSLGATFGQLIVDVALHTAGAALPGIRMFDGLASVPFAWQNLVGATAVQTP